MATERAEMEIEMAEILPEGQQQQQPQCGQCQSKFKSLKSLEIHKKKRVCLEKRKKAAAEAEAAKHISEDELRATKLGQFYVCPTCKKIYTKKMSIKSHLQKDACSIASICSEKHDHQILEKLFDSRDEALSYIREKELDAFFFKRSSYGLNEYYRCNRSVDKAMAKNYVTVRKITKKLIDSCPARFTLSKTSLITPEVFTNPDLKKEDYYRERFVLKGCLTHSHEMGNVESIRLPDVVRTSVVQLFKLGVSVQQMREKYLKTSFFGGTVGKIPKEGIFTKLQRRNVPFPPDTSINEREMMFRYVPYKPIRTFNFKIAGDPGTSNFGRFYHKKNGAPEDGRGSWAKAVELDHFFVAYMDDHQRGLFRKRPGTLIVYCTQNIYRFTNYCLISVLVLDVHGTGTPVLQAVTAADPVDSARVIVETLKDQEPESCEKIKLLVADDYCYNSFIEAIANVLKPSVLTTLPLHLYLIEQYDRMLQFSMTGLSDRIDDVMYNLFTMNRAIERRHKRIESGMCGRFGSKIKVQFEKCHPNVARSDLTRLYTISQESTKDELSWTVVEVQSGNQYVVTKNTGRMICGGGENCRVFCGRCGPKGCLHEFSCTCADFIEVQCCLHLHVMLMEFNVTPEALKSPDIEYPLIKGTRMKSKRKMTDEEFERAKESATKRLASILLVVQSLKNSDAAKGLIDDIKYLSESSKIVENFDLCPTTTTVVSTKSKDPISILVNRNATLNNPDLKSKTNEAVNRSTLDFVSAESQPKILMPTGVVVGDGDLNQNPLETKQKPDQVRNPESTSGRSDCNTEKPQEVTALGKNNPRKNLMKRALVSEPSDLCWPSLSSTTTIASILEILASDFEQKDREVFLDKMISAKSLWECHKCHSNNFQSSLDGYVECSHCLNWFHINCCDLKSDDPNFVCSGCTVLQQHTEATIATIPHEEDQMIKEETVLFIPTNSEGEVDFVQMIYDE